MQPLIDLFDIKDLMPHGYCLSWNPVLLWLHVISDLLITLAYYSIPLILIYFIRQRKDLPYPWLVAMFAGFIVACGTTHLLSAITIWMPLYWLDGLLKGFTAILSVTTAVLMLWIIPRALSLPSAAQLQAEIQQRKTAEEALHIANVELQSLANVAHTQLLLDSALDGIIRMDHNGNVTSWNTQAEHIFGYSSEQALGREMTELIVPPAYRERCRQGASQFMMTGSSNIICKRMEVTGLRAGGSEFPMELTVGALKQNDNYLFSASVQDITERKQAQQLLQDKEQMLSESQRIAHIGSWSLELATGYLSWSDEMFRIYGVAQETFGHSVKALLDLIHPDDCAAMDMWISDCLAGIESRELDFRIMLPDGTVRFIRGSGGMQYDEMQRPLRMVGSAQDITERKQAERLLYQLKAMIEISLDGFWIVDLSGNVLQVNEGFAKISGYSINELQDMHTSQLEATAESEQIIAHIAKVVTLWHDQFETRLRHKNGHHIVIEVSATFLPEFQQFCVFCRDITERKHREQQEKKHLDELAHVTRLGLMGEMASGIAHEINQPLSAIATYAQVSLNLIKAENPDLVKLSEVVTKTQQEALRAGNIIHRMRKFIKSHKTNNSTADINKLIHNAVDLCMADLKQSNIKLTFELEKNLPAVHVDHVQIEQVIINLIRNSIDVLKNLSAEKQRHLTIHSHLIPNNAIRVSVKDNGPGLDEDQQQKIVMPFYTTKADGMGMGLSISRSLIEAHNGALHFNTKPGKGTTFYFTLPIPGKYDEH